MGHIDPQWRAGGAGACEDDTLFNIKPIALLVLPWPKLPHSLDKCEVEGCSIIIGVTTAVFNLMGGQCL